MDRYHNKKKKSVGKIVLKIVLFFLLILVAAGGYVGWQVWSDLQSTTDNMYEAVEDRQEHAARQEKPVDVDSGEDPFTVLIVKGSIKL